MIKILVLSLLLSITVASQANTLNRFKQIKIFDEKYYQKNKELLKLYDHQVIHLKEVAQVIPDECKFTKEETTLIDGQSIWCRPIKIKTVNFKEFNAVQSINKTKGIEQLSEKNNNVNILESIFMDVDKLIAIGNKVIELVEAGKPVVTNKPLTVSVLPRTNDKDFALNDMSGWSIPKTVLFKVIYKNVYGMEVVTFNYTVTFQYNGNYNGKGKYLNGIRLAARDIEASWGFNLSANTELLAISNVGTKDNVVAGATIEINYTVNNWLKNITTAESFFIDGRGNIYKLN